MVKNVDKFLKEKYNQENIRNYNKDDISNIILKANIRKKKDLYKKIYGILTCIVILSLFILLNINRVIVINNDLLDINIIVNNAKTDSIKNNLNNYSKIFPKENEKIIFSKNSAFLVNEKEPIKDNSYDYILTVRISEILEYSYDDNLIDDVPKTKFRAEVIEKIKGDVENIIEFYSDGAIVPSKYIRPSLDMDDTYIKYVPLNYPDIGSSYVIYLRIYGDKLYAEKVEKV